MCQPSCFALLLFKSYLGNFSCKFPVKISKCIHGMVEILYKLKKKTLISRPLKWCHIGSEAHGMTVNTFFKHALYCLQNIVKLPVHAIDAKHASNGVSYADTIYEKQ